MTKRRALDGLTAAGLAAGLGGDREVAHRLVFFQGLLGRALRALTGMFSWRPWRFPCGNIVPQPRFRSDFKRKKHHGREEKSQGTPQEGRNAASRAHKAAQARGHHHPANSNEPHLSRRPMWQGQLRLSLVSCPVALYNAASKSSDISFHLLNPKTNNRIRMIPTDPDTGPVERADLVKGYEISKNHYVVLTQR